MIHISILYKSIQAFFTSVYICQRAGSNMVPVTGTVALTVTVTIIATVTVTVAGTAHI